MYFPAPKNIEENNKYFCEAFVCLKFRKCSVAVKYFMEDSNSEPFEPYVVEIDESVDNNYRCTSEISLVLSLNNNNTINVTSPALFCIVRNYSSGKTLPPLTFHIIPDPRDKRASYLVEEINNKKFKLKRLVQSALEISDLFN